MYLYAWVLGIQVIIVHYFFTKKKVVHPNNLGTPWWSGNDNKPKPMQ